MEDLHGKGVIGLPHLVELDDRLRGTLYGHWYTLGTWAGVLVSVTDFRPTLRLRHGP